jgi:cyclophilin family peptidyl-prolyl cis-trans isomerase/HEAT repeat protein
VLLLLMSLCVAGTLQEVRQLEWDRAATVTIGAQYAGETADVRIAVAQALGRLHRSEAAPFLEQMQQDPDGQVRAAVADALGWTPGTAALLRARLAVLNAPVGLAERRASERGERTRTIVALGRQGDASDIPLLASLMSEPWPTSAAAAEALGRLGRRGIDGAAAARAPLAKALSRPDPRTVEMAAYALARIGLEDAEAVVLQAASRVALQHQNPWVRAWLSKAVIPAWAAEGRGDRFVAAMGDSHRAVRAAALDVVEAGDVPVELISPWLASEEAWVRQAAIGALGRMGEFATLRGLLEETDDPYEAAFAMRAAGDPLGVDWAEADDPVIAAGALEVAGGIGPEARVAIALDANRATSLRTAAVAGLLEAETPDPAVGQQLLASSDVVVREAALELIAQAGPTDQINWLVPYLRVERDLELLGSGLVLVADALPEARRALKGQEAHLESAIRRAAQSSTARVRRAGQRAADAAGVEAQPRAEATQMRELVLPSGEVVEVPRGVPIVSETSRIRGAVVETTKGTIHIAFMPDIAPMAVHNFARLAEAGFFDNVPFHRVVPGFVAQTGCPRGDGWGGPGWTLPDEVSSEPYTSGAVGMARSAPWDTGGSQWFISTAPTPHLVGDYTLFGHVSHGLHTARAMERGDQVLSVTIERTAP